VAQPSQLADTSCHLNEVANVHIPSVGLTNKISQALSVVWPNTTNLKIPEIRDVPESTSLGSLIKTLRRGHGLTQVDLAEAIGVVRSTIAGIEGGHYMPGRETLNALADFFKVPLDDLRKVVAPRQIVQGELVNDPDELAWLNLWRRLSDAQRTQLLMRAFIPPKEGGSAN